MRVRARKCVRAYERDAIEGTLLHFCKCLIDIPQLRTPCGGKLPRGRALRHFAVEPVDKVFECTGNVSQVEAAEMMPIDFARGWSYHVSS